MTTETDLMQEALDILRNLDSYQSSCTCSQCQVITALLAKIDAMPAGETTVDTPGHGHLRGTGGTSMRIDWAIRELDGLQDDVCRDVVTRLRNRSAFLAASQRHGGG